MAGQGEVLYLPLGPRPQVNHFVDANEMVHRVKASVGTRCYGLSDDFGEVAPVLVAQEHLRVPGQPELRPGVRVLLQHVLETCMQADDQLFPMSLPRDRLRR
jgi:hypothetical protein